MNITFLEAHHLFDYDPLTGLLAWGEGGGAIRKGRKAGAHTNKRVQVRLPDASTALANRLIWLWMTGEESSANLQHANRDTLDLRWSNITRCGKNHPPVGGLRLNPVGLWEGWLYVDDAPRFIGGYTSHQSAAKAYSDARALFVGDAK